ncbi:MAG: hypothetical protein Q8R15_04995 [Candidatus Micrarchaeota archaeon]|nr:hypothetical protein [Candidatus Micrarchaeota archaeon]
MIEQIIEAIRQVRTLHGEGFSGKRTFRKGPVSEVRNIGRQIWATVRSHPIVDLVKFIPYPTGSHQVFIEMHLPKSRLPSTRSPMGVVLLQHKALKDKIRKAGYELEEETGPNPEQKAYHLMKDGRSKGHLRTELVGRVESTVGIVADNEFAEDIARLFLEEKKELGASKRKRLK